MGTTMKEVFNLWNLRPSKFESDCILNFVKPDPSAPILFPVFLDFYALYYFFSRARDQWKDLLDRQVDLNAPGVLASLLASIGVPIQEQLLQEHLWRSQGQPSSFNVY